MTTVTRICDRCKKQVESSDDLNTLRLTFTNTRFHSYSGGYTEQQSTIPPVEWCRECCEDSGFVGYQNKEHPKPAPTFEEMLREMVESVVSERLPS